MPRDYTDELSERKSCWMNSPLGGASNTTRFKMNQQLVPYKPLPPLPRTRRQKKQKQQQPQPSKKKAPRARKRRAGRAAIMSSIPRQTGNQLAAAYSVGQTTVRPNIRSDGVSCRIVHRELILKVAMTVLYNVQQISINPGLPNSFPWLSAMAQGWETYRFNRLRFCYFTRVGSATGGSVILAPDYDASDSTPASEQIASSYIDTAEDVSWKDICCTLRPEGMHALGPKKFVRTTALSANQDIKTFDAGNLNVATVDGVAGPAGNLWVEYDITLSNPQLNPSGNGAAYQHFLTATGAVTGNLMPNYVDKSLANYATFATNVLTFTQAGRYEVLLFISAATSATETGPSNVIGGAGGVRQDYAVIGNGTMLFEDDMVIDALVGTTVTYPITVVGVAATDLLIIPLAVRSPY